MTSNTYYFTADGEEATSVQADSYEQVTSGDITGQCPNVDYIIRATVRTEWNPQEFGRANFFRNIVYTSFATGTTGGFYVLPGNWAGSNRNVNGYLCPPLSKYSAVGVPSANFARPRSNQRFSQNYSIRITELLSEAFERVDGLPDDCGEGVCTTEFTRGGQLIYTVDSCPVISEEPPGCNQCCSELLPLMRGLSLGV